MARFIRPNKPNPYYQAFGVVYRQFSNTSVNYLPRGVVHSKLKQAKEFEDDQIQNSNFTSEQNQQKRPKSPKSKPILPDNRSIDDIDPVILKYVNIMNDLSSVAAAKERFHGTNFGAIRFDSDNIPYIHGQFDGVEKPDTSVLVSRIMKTPDVKVQHLIANDYARVSDSEISATDVEDFHNDVERTPIMNPVADQSKLDTRAAVSPEPMSEGEKTFLELFGDRDDDEHSSSFGHEFSDSHNDASHNSFSKELVDDVNDSNYIDSNFFGSSSQSSSYSMQRNDQKSPHLSRSNSLRMQDIDTTSDMNFIDETYFKSSLDTLKDNRRPSVEYSDIKEDVEKSFLDDSSGSKPVMSRKDKRNLRDVQSKLAEPASASNVALEYLGIDPSVQSFPPSNSEQTKEKKRPPSAVDPTPKTAYEYVLKKRKELHDLQFGFNPDDDSPSPTATSYQKVLSLVREKTTEGYTKHEILSLLKKSIIFDQFDIVGLYKPYGIAMHKGGEGQHHILQRYLPELAHHLGVEELHMVHRLDVKTTGVMILARTPSMASTLKEMFKNHEIKKTYWAITKGIPKPLHGTIDIPISEGLIGNKRRMVLRPDVDGFRGNTSLCQRAVTNYRVLGHNVGASLMEIKPETGAKHQIRVHLGFGISCPVLGDHKYSYLKKMVPQKLPGDMLQRLKIQQSKVRTLPMYLHSKSVIIPEVNKGKNVFIQAKLPAYFNKTLSMLKLNSRKYAIRYTDSKCVDE